MKTANGKTKYLLYFERIITFIPPDNAVLTLDGIPAIGSKFWDMVAEYERWCRWKYGNVTNISRLFPWYLLKYPQYSKIWCEQHDLEFLGRDNVPRVFGRHLPLQPCLGILEIGIRDETHDVTPIGNKCSSYELVLAITPKRGENVYGLTPIIDPENYKFIPKDD
jgi:hypothetical protein